MSNFGIVVIGRNEGDRLRNCLRSLSSLADSAVYVDSGSTDGSVATARAAGFDVVELDASLPFTAGRARNAGLERLVLRRPDLEYVQFVDGDCELASGWIETALRELTARPDTAVVFGRRRERFPDASPYNRLCDMEWNTPLGPADACGGDTMMRVAALRQIGAFNPALPVGEEVEMSARLRARGWKLLRIGAEMTLHDAAMTRFSQWWRRSVRAGFGITKGALGFDQPVQPEDVRDLKSILAWAVALPVVALGAAWPTYGASLILLAGYFVLYRRIRRHRLEHGDPAPHARIYAFFCTLGKFAQARGALLCLWRHLRGRNQRRIIEYKGPAAQPSK